MPNTGRMYRSGRRALQARVMTVDMVVHLERCEYLNGRLEVSLSKDFTARLAHSGYVEQFFAVAGRRR